MGYTFAMCWKKFLPTRERVRAIWVSVLLTGLMGNALADRLIEIPTGSIVYPARLRLEGGALIGKTNETRAQLFLRPTPNLELHGVRTGFDRRTELYGLQYTVIPEVLGYSPGLSVGVSDIFDRSREGRGYFVAISYGLASLGETPLDLDLRIHLGFGFEGMPSFFIGFEVPLTNQFVLLAEHTGERVNFGASLRVSEYLQVRASVVRGQTYWSASLRLWED